MGSFILSRFSHRVENDLDSRMPTILSSKPSQILFSEPRSRLIILHALYDQTLKPTKVLQRKESVKCHPPTVFPPELRHFRKSSDNITDQYLNSVNSITLIIRQGSQKQVESLQLYDAYVVQLQWEKRCFCVDLATDE
jgi:hypothetical protein